MPTLRFEGNSDDTFGEYAFTNDDYDNCASGKPIEYLVQAGGESLVVVGKYGAGASGGWSIGVAPYYDAGPDDVPIPQWPIRIERSDHAYSPALVIEAPEGVTLRCLQRSDDE